jgi:hypothetical protein
MGEVRTLWEPRNEQKNTQAGRAQFETHAADKWVGLSGGLNQERNKLPNSTQAVS